MLNEKKTSSSPLKNRAILEPVHEECKRKYILRKRQEFEAAKEMKDFLYEHTPSPHPEEGPTKVFI